MQPFEFYDIDYLKTHLDNNEMIDLIEDQIPRLIKNLRFKPEFQ